MAKVKSVFYCQNCGAQSSKWVGKCSSCNEWNTYVEEIQTAKKKSSGLTDVRSSRPKLLHEIEQNKTERIVFPDNEFNRTLGGGLVYGSLTLIGGEPGIGKSTLMLQLAGKLQGKKILYLSGEESESQIRLRAERIGFENENCYVLAETSLEHVQQHFNELRPDLMIVDSIQTLHTAMIDAAPGSVSQIRTCANEILQIAKQSGTAVVLIGHITKDGTIAGPKILEHMVDTVLQFEGDRNHMYRMLRPLKNRFGSTSELGIYEMRGSGLQEVKNPSSILISERDEALSGTAVACTLEGIRPMMIETQALVSTAVYGTPQRSATGFDLRRLNMLLAVLEKRCGFNLASQDVFLNITGGIKVEDPAIDLAVICAILSSSCNKTLSSSVCFAGEVGLSGEIRPITHLEQRAKEAEKLGFESFWFSRYNAKNLKVNSIDLQPVATVEELFSSLFGQ